jgi:photosystem II stability/assembly factor-like uncharacterized protein
MQIMIQKLILLSLILCWAGHGLHAQWTVMHIDENAYTLQSKIKFLDDSTGLYMGSNSIILKSKDAGETWYSIEVETGINFTEFQFVNDSVIHAVGYRTSGTKQGWDSKMIRSEDRGDTWNSVADFSGKQLMSLWFFDNDTGLVADSGGIYRTVDSGAIWENVWSFSQYGYYTGEFRKLCFPSEQVGYTVGSGIVQTPLSIDNLLLRTSDAGLTWDIVHTFSHSLTTVHFINQDTGYIGTECGMVLKTTDGSNTWKETQVSGWGSAVNSIHFISANTGFATGSPLVYPTKASGLSFFVAKTIDGGENWVSYDTIGIPLNSIYFLNDSIGFVSGLYGLIMRTEGRIDQLPDDYPWHLAGVTNIIEINPEFRKESRVKLYPNPANDVLHVDIDHSLLPSTEIIIYNVQGVALKHKHVNGYTHTISLGDLHKGLYFVRIKNGPHILWHKIIINP